MKTLTVVLRSAAAVVFAFVMSSASCSLFDGVDDVTFDAKLEHVFTIDEKAISSGPKVYTKYELIDAAKVNTEFDKYKDKIKSVTVKSVKYTVMNYTTSDKVIFTNGKAGFSSANATTMSTLASLGVEDIQAAQNALKDLPYSQGDLDALANLIKDDKKCNVYLTGTFSKTPVAFQVKFTLECTLVADAL